MAWLNAFLAVLSNHGDGRRDRECTSFGMQTAAVSDSASPTNQKAVCIDACTFPFRLVKFWYRRGTVTFYFICLIPRLMLRLKEMQSCRDQVKMQLSD